ncbi:hypothetical protein AaE_008894 [Aphanomyces astaci]|uniref:Magnesium transporter n=2 Tax=Aphanomyces astaci TaxID=112090 RepID=A0A6A5AC28_APHAT|nr:hypothetical protein AaE_008894 [Aphanomyces astaci]
MASSSRPSATSAPFLDSLILPNDTMLISQNGNLLGLPTSPHGRRLALRFDSAGNAEYHEVSRTDVLKTIQTAARNVVFNPTGDAPASPKTVAASDRRQSRSRTRARFIVDAAVEIPAVHMRDIRKLDNVFSASNEPSITVRQQAILVNCDPVRAVIMRDCCLVFLPDGADSLISHLKKNFKQHVGEAIAFEFAALEAILATICRVFAMECEKVIPLGRSALDKMTKDDSMMGELEGLRSIKNAMSTLEAQVGGMRRLLMSLLENEEDLHMMYLTKLHNDPGLVHDLFSYDTEDVESFLEVYLQNSMDTTRYIYNEIYGSQTRVALMANNILNTESIVMLKLDAKRNFLLSVDLSLTLMGTLLAMPTFIVGAFGMNLNSYIQETDYIFWIVFAVCIQFVLVGYYVVVQFLKLQGINMSWKY